MGEEVIKQMDGGVVEGVEISGGVAEGEGEETDGGVVEGEEEEEDTTSSNSSRQTTATITAVPTTTTGGEGPTVPGAIKMAITGVSEESGKSCFSKAAVEHPASRQSLLT